MKSVLAVLLVCLVAVQAGRLRREEKYTTQYDKIVLKDVFENERLFNGYVACLMDNGPCTPDGKELKDKIPEALEDECAKCNARQKDGIEETVIHLINNKPAIWEDFKKKFDPKNQYQARYDHYLKKAQEKKVG